MGLLARTEALNARHKEIDFALFEEERRPSPDFSRVHELKRKKLKIKDELHRMVDAS